MSDELKVTAWITDGSLRRLKPDRNFSRNTVPVHARKSVISNIGLVLRTDAERLLAERDALRALTSMLRAELQSTKDALRAEVERLRTTIYHVAAIAHCGGWVGLSEDQAIAYVRALTFGDVPGDTLDSSAAALTEAIAAARAAQEGKT